MRRFASPRRLLTWAFAFTFLFTCRPGELLTREQPPPARESTEQTPTKPRPDDSIEVAPAEPPPRVAVLNPEIRSARRAAQRAVLASNEPPIDDLPPWSPDVTPVFDFPLATDEGATAVPDPTAKAPGFFVPLEIAEGTDPLQPFHAALAELDAQTRESPVHITFHGASAIAADLWTAYVRSYLQHRFGNGGPGMVAAARPTKWFRHHEFQLESSPKWRKHSGYQLEGEDDPGLFGVMGQAMSSRARRVWSELAPGRGANEPEAIAWYEFHHLLQPGGGRYQIRVDDRVVATISTDLEDKAAPPRLGRQRVYVAPGQHTLRIETLSSGEVRMLGVVAETDRPGVVVDNLGVGGAIVANQRYWNEALWTEQLHARDPVLYVLYYGNNESVHEDVPLSRFEADYRAMLERFQRAVPNAACVVVGPGDFPKVDEEGRLHPRPRLAAIRQIQRELAMAHGCAFFDLLKMVGGEGSMRAWVHAGLARDDHLHLTRRGYVRVGMAFADALMRGYDLHRVGQGEGSLAASG